VVELEGRLAGKDGLPPLLRTCSADELSWPGRRLPLAGCGRGSNLNLGLSNFLGEEVEDDGVALMVTGGDADGFAALRPLPSTPGLRIPFLR